MIFLGQGLTLFDIPKDVVFVEVLVLSNIFGFPMVNWAPKWTKTVSFGCVPFEPKFKVLKDLSNTVFFFIGRLLLAKISARLNSIWGSKGPKPLKGAISWVLNQHKKL